MGKKITNKSFFTKSISLLFYEAQNIVLTEKKIIFDDHMFYKTNSKMSNENRCWKIQGQKQCQGCVLLPWTFIAVLWTHRQDSECEKNKQ